MRIFFLFRICQGVSQCGGDGADGTIRACVRPTETLTSTLHQKQLWLLKVVFFLLGFQADSDSFKCEGTAWISLQTSVLQILLFDGQFWASQSSERRCGRQEYSTDAQLSHKWWSLWSDLHFLSIYKAANWVKRLQQGISIAWTNKHISISPLWHSFLSWTIAPSRQK